MNGKSQCSYLFIFFTQTVGSSHQYKQSKIPTDEQLKMNRNEQGPQYHLSQNVLDTMYGIDNKFGRHDYGGKISHGM